MQYITTPDTQTPHPDQTRPQEAHPDQTPTKGTVAGAILKGHHRPRPEAAEPPTEERPDPKTPNHHQDKRQQNDRGTTRTDRRRHTRGRTEATREDTRQISRFPNTTDKTTARPDMRSGETETSPKATAIRGSEATGEAASPPQGQTAHTDR